MGKNKNSLKRKRDKNLENETQTVEEEVPPAKRYADDSIPRKEKWTNKQRVLVFASRGINHRDRHLMEDLKRLMPHHKPESKMERNKNLSVVNEICEMKNCNKALMFEGRKKRDLYVWMSYVPNGPSMKFLVENVHTMGELKLTGNCLKSTRPLLSFDKNFEKPHYALMKEVLAQTFGVPNHHPKSQPFFDHVYTFSILDQRIWFRNFQILSEDGALCEIGPRFVLNPVKIFQNSFGGQVLWKNPNYISPAKYRQQLNSKHNLKYQNRVQQKVLNELTQPKNSYELTPLNDIFEKNPSEKAQEIIEQKNNPEKDLEYSSPERKLKKKKKKLPKKANSQGKSSKKVVSQDENTPEKAKSQEKKLVNLSPKGKIKNKVMKLKKKSSNKEAGSILRIKKKNISTK